jgi:histidyl-tRNA synthetase
MLQALEIDYELNPRLVRGLDYYSRTVFEWITDALGAQDAVCSGGRYDGLIGQLGGEPTPAVGFALGVERAVELLRQAQPQEPSETPHVYVIASAGRPALEALRLIERLRDLRPEYRYELALGGGNFKAQFRRADRSGAPLALILGEAELARGVVALKPLRAESGQSECPLAELPARLEGALATARAG